MNSLRAILAEEEEDEGVGQLLMGSVYLLIRFLNAVPDLPVPEHSPDALIAYILAGWLRVSQPSALKCA